MKKIEAFKSKLNTIVFGVKTKAGKRFDLFLISIISISIVIVMLESIPDVFSKYGKLLIGLEWFITLLFTLEYFTRIWISKSKKKYIFSFYGIIDLLSALPMYLSLFFPGLHHLAVLRSIRLLRIFEILRSYRFMQESNRLSSALVKSFPKILIFIFSVLIITIISGALMFEIEGAEAGFTSIPMGVYWAVVTLTTVGFGDITPLTPLGKFISVLIMIMGWGIIAVPTGLVTAEATKENTLKSLGKQERNKCVRCGSSIRQPKDNFCSSCGIEL
ncbi:MAG: ion transporter [Flavobacteriaceae bacterium]|nr:ion transporter [Flavobacteriaceae bacterium]